MKCISMLSQCVYLKTSVAGKTAFVTISVSKILVAGRKKTHKNLVRKCNLTFTGYTAINLKTVVHQLSDPEDHFQQSREGGGVCRGFPFASQGGIHTINVYPKQLKVTALGLWGAATHIVRD